MINRRDFLKIGGASLVALAGCQSPNYTIPKPTLQELAMVSFDDAKGDVRLRQRYIDEIVRLYPSPSPKLTGVVYRNDVFLFENPKLPGTKTVMSTQFGVLPKSSVVTGLKVEVYKSGFEVLVNEDEFLSSFIDHEYAHVKDIGEGFVLDVPMEVALELPRITEINSDLFVHFLELRGFYNQIQNFPQRKRISSKFRADAIGTYMFDRSFIERRERTPLISWILETYPTM